MTEQVNAAGLPDSGQKYHRVIRPLKRTKVVAPPGSIVVDFYAICDACQVKNPAIAHALKKLLFCGLRNKGDAIQDATESIDAIVRGIEMMKDELEAEKNTDVIQV